MPDTLQEIIFDCFDDGYDFGAHIDDWEPSASAGVLQAKTPIPGVNGPEMPLDWTSPPNPGLVTIKATFWWPDGHSCHVEEVIDVQP